MGPSFTIPVSPSCRRVRTSLTHNFRSRSWFFVAGILQKHRLLITDTALLRDIFVQRAHLFRKPVMEMRELRKVTGNSGLLSSEGKVHIRQKRIIGRAFEFDALKGIMPIFSEKTKKVLDSWKANQAPFEVEMRNMLTSLTLDIIGVSAFGYEFRALEGSESDVHEAYTKLFPSISWARILKVYLPFLRK